MDRYTPPPIGLAGRIRAMEPKSTILITDSPYTSVKARVSQLRREFKMKRLYRTGKEKKGHGTRVWRDA